MLLRAAVLFALGAVAGCGPDCGALARQMSAIAAGPSRCVGDSDCAVYVGACLFPPLECGFALDAADSARMDQLQQRFRDAACPTDLNPGACGCRIGTQPGAAACANGACTCAGGSCLVSTTM